MKTGYKVGEIMNPDVVTTTPDESIYECAKKIAKEKIGCLIIAENKKTIGIITEQDLVRKVMAQGADIQSPVKTVMSTTLYDIEPEKDIYEAIQLMGINSIKHLPVISKNQLVGIITSKDITAIEPALLDILQFKSTKKKECD